MIICLLNSGAGLATFNILQVLKAKFSADDDVKFIVLTGGSDNWHLESKYISADKDLLPAGETTDKIS